MISCSVSLITDDVEQTVMCLLAICISVRYLFIFLLSSISFYNMFVGPFNSMDIIPLLYFVCKYGLCHLSFNFISGSFDHIEILNFYVFKSVFS